MGFKGVMRGGFVGRKAYKKRVAAQTHQGNVKFLVSHDLFEKIGSPERVSVFVGDGDDSGKILISPGSSDESRTFKFVHPHPRGQAFVVIGSRKIGYKPPDDEMIELPFRVTAEGIMITLSSN